jgi:hypothetical protein
VAAVMILSPGREIGSHSIQGKLLFGFPLHLALCGPRVLLLISGVVGMGLMLFLEYREHH